MSTTKLAPHLVETEIVLCFGKSAIEMYHKIFIMRGLEQLTLQMYQLPPEINKEIISAQDADFACYL